MIKPSKCGDEETINMEIGGKVVGIDISIVDIVWALNSSGIKTMASCSGHGNRPGLISLADGRDIFIVYNFNDGRKIDRCFKDIHGHGRIKRWWINTTIAIRHIVTRNK